jgi:folate-binding protein YgfZ
MTNTQWQTDLIAQGAFYAENVLLHFGDAEQERKHLITGNVLCDLSHLTLLKLSGADASNFLQGQVTNDVKQLNGLCAHYTGYCTPKGRLLAIFLAFAQQDQLYLQMPASIAEGVAKRLRMYVLRSKVMITDTAEGMIKMGLNGPNAEQILSAHFADLPTEPYALKTYDHTTVVRLPSIENQQRYEILSTIEHANALWIALKLQANPVGKACWDWLEIHTGIPEILPATQEQFVPQMVNLDLLNAINFKKGCYTGQEIVARTHYLGSVKRRTFLMQLASETAPSPGDKLLDTQQSEVGQVVRVAPDLANGNGFNILAELRLEAQQTGPIYWNQHKLNRLTLPYSLEIAEA